MKFLVFFIVVFSQLAEAKPIVQISDMSCYGDWEVEPILNEDFYSNFRIKYPKKISINHQQIIYSNISYYGGKYYDAEINCSVNYYTDKERGGLVFETCMASSNPDNAPLVYKIQCEGTKMSGSVSRDKRLFEFVGMKAN